MRDMTPLRITIARHGPVDRWLGGRCRDTLAGRIEDLTACSTGRFGRDGKPAAITGVMGCYVGNKVGFDRAAESATKIRSVVFTAADGGLAGLFITGGRVPLPATGEVLRSEAGAFEYSCRVQPRPKLGA